MVSCFGQTITLVTLLEVIEFILGVKKNVDKRGTEDREILSKIYSPTGISDIK